MTMVDISGKPAIFREATATGIIRLKPSTVQLIQKGGIAKGDPVYAAKLAGIRAAKETSALIPLCHPLPMTNIVVDIEISEKSAVQVTSTVNTKAQTGVEMEALVSTSVSLLTIWDMVKQYEKNAEGQYPSTAIENIHVVKKIKKDDRKKTAE